MSDKGKSTQETAGDDPVHETTRVSKGVRVQSALLREHGPPADTGTRSTLSTKQYIEGVRTQDRAMLARTITLVESNAPRHMKQAQEVIRCLQPHAGRSIRLGITGVPGAGKSTFIEAIGLHLLNLGHKVAVLAVDPTSTLSGGSILADKTRMEKLSLNSGAFVRPSPTGGALGGVARKTRESIIVCEAAGFDVILVETVGSGQSEVSVRSMVDFFLLLLITGAGDDLQGIKRGVMEMVDAVVINKADGDNRVKALAARAETNRALRFLNPVTTGWQPRALACSAITGEGITEFWDVVELFRSQTKESGAFDDRRRQQSVTWLHALIDEQLRHKFFGNDRIKQRLPMLEAKVLRGDLSPSVAAKELLQLIEPESQNS